MQQSARLRSHVLLELLRLTFSCFVRWTVSVRAKASRDLLSKLPTLLHHLRARCTPYFQHLQPFSHWLRPGSAIRTPFSPGRTTRLATSSPSVPLQPKRARRTRSSRPKQQERSAILHSSYRRHPSSTMTWNCSMRARPSAANGPPQRPTFTSHSCRADL